MLDKAERQHEALKKGRAAYRSEIKRQKTEGRIAQDTLLDTPLVSAAWVVSPKTERRKKSTESDRS